MTRGSGAAHGNILRRACCVIDARQRARCVSNDARIARGSAYISRWHCNAYRVALRIKRGITRTRGAAVV